jgi:hypothetical protein
MKNLSKLKPLDIYGQNELNRISSEILTNLIPQFKKYINKKMYTADGKRTANTPLNIETPTDGHIDGHYRNTSAYFSRSSSALWLKVKICYNGGDHYAKPHSTAYTQYFEREIYLGKLNGQNLEEIQEADQIIKTYNLGEIYDLEEINAQIEEFNDLLNQAQQKVNEIPFYFKK